MPNLAKFCSVATCSDAWLDETETLFHVVADLFLVCKFNALYAGKLSHEFSFFQNSDQSGEQFRFRSGPVKRRPRSVSKLF